jgi:hypothetical protein
MATINWSFADLFKGDAVKKETTTNMVMNALNAAPEQRDVRVHDCRRKDKVYRFEYSQACPSGCTIKTCR